MVPVGVPRELVTYAKRDLRRKQVEARAIEIKTAIGDKNNLADVF
jgi:hypothetical protein